MGYGIICHAMTLRRPQKCCGQQAREGRPCCETDGREAWPCEQGHRAASGAVTGSLTRADKARSVHKCSAVDAIGSFAQRGLDSAREDQEQGARPTMAYGHCGFIVGCPPADWLE